MKFVEIMILLLMIKRNLSSVIFSNDLANLSNWLLNISKKILLLLIDENLERSFLSK